MGKQMSTIMWIEVVQISKSKIIKRDISQNGMTPYFIY